MFWYRCTSIQLNAATVLLQAQCYLKPLQKFTAVSQPEAAVITSDHYGTANIGAYRPAAC
jgi:hypothetical protein